MPKLNLGILSLAILAVWLAAVPDLHAQVPVDDTVKQVALGKLVTDKHANGYALKEVQLLDSMNRTVQGPQISQLFQPGTPIRVTFFQDGRPKTIQALR